MGNSNPLKPFTLTVDAPKAVRMGDATKTDGGIPVQRFEKAILPVGRLVKRRASDRSVIWDETFTPERQSGLVKTFMAMRDGGVPVRLMDATRQYTVDAPKTPLTKDHAGAFDKDPATRLKKLSENVLGDPVDMFIKDGWVTGVFDVRGQDAINLVEKTRYVSPEIDPCMIDGTTREYGEAITAVSLVANPLIPGQPEFVRIAASADEGERLILSFEDEEQPMKSLFPLIAALAGVAASTINEANAEETLKGVQTKVATIAADNDRLTKAMSADDADPDPAMLGMSARLIEKELESTFRPLLSDGGLKELNAWAVGNRAERKFSSFIMSHETPEDAVTDFEKLAKIFRDNKPVERGGKTGLQRKIAGVDEVDDDKAGDADPTKVSADRINQLLSETVTGREMLAVSGKK